MLYHETLIQKIATIENQREGFLTIVEPAYPSDNSNIYRFKDFVPPHLLVIYEPQSRHYKEIGGTDEQKVIQLQTMSRLLRKYYGHSVVPMSYFILKNQTSSRIALIRPEVVGIPVDQLPLNSPERFDGFTQKIYWETIWKELLEDPEIANIHPTTRQTFLFFDFSLGNIIYQAPDSYYITDW